MIAFLREVSPRLEGCELLHAQRTEIDAKLARKQHARFADVLKEVGATVKLVPSLPDQPDGAFVEHAAVILPEAVVITRFSSPSRQPEIETVASALAEYRPVVRIAAPATLEGSDVLRVGHKLFVGRSARTTAEGIAALVETVEPFGYEVQPVEIHNGVHLKTACTFVPPHFLLVNPAWVETKPFAALRVIEVDEHEPFAANTLTLAGTTLIGGAFAKTEQRLHEVGVSTRRADVSEFLMAGAGLSSLCLLLEPRPARASASAGMTFIEATKAPRVNGYFSAAIVHGGVVYVAGQLPLDQITGRPIVGDIEAQTEQLLRNLGAVLESSGSALSRTMKLTFYLANLKLSDRVTEVCARILSGHRPTAFFVEAKSLQAGCLVAVDATAVVADE